jgi:ribosomal protein L11 methyltransferase
MVFPQDAAVPIVAEGELALALLQPSGSVVFGDGSHATTRLCAAAVDWLCRQRKPGAVLDVGTGTGILARIARARGTRHVVGTDIDAAALESATAHAVLDEHATGIHFSRELPDHWGARFDLVVANILEEPLRTLAPFLVRALRPGGTLLISGFTRPQAPALRVVYERLGLTFAGSSDLDGWTLLTFDAGSSRPGGIP